MVEPNVVMIIILCFGLIGLAIYVFLYISPTIALNSNLNNADIKSLNEYIKNLEIKINDLSNLQKNDIVELKNKYIPDIVNQTETKLNNLINTNNNSILTNISDIKTNNNTLVTNFNKLNTNNNVLQSNINDLQKLLSDLKTLHISEITDLKNKYIPNLLDNLRGQILSLKTIVDNLIKQDLQDILKNIDDVKELNKNQTEEIIGILTDFSEKFKNMNDVLESKELQLSTENKKWVIKMIDNNLCLGDSETGQYYCVNENKDLVEIKI